MFGRKLIAALAALILLAGGAMAIGRHIDSVNPDTLFPDHPIFNTKEQAIIEMAQNENNTTAENGKTESEPATGESEPAATDDKKTSDVESKPPAPFVPSEQIAGEQAVDFPADI